MRTFQQFIEAAEFGQRLKLFGTDAARVTTAEMQQIYDELRLIFKNDLSEFSLTKTLATKPDHGDIDILVLANPGVDLEALVRAKLGNKVLKYSKNDNIHSFLYQSQLGKNVHIDFILSTSPEAHRTRNQYYSFNDLAAIVGIIAKKLNFKYGTEGFFKRFQDKRGIWHNIIISQDLNDGLRILGFKVEKLELIRSSDDIFSFIMSSPLIGVDLFSDLNAEYRQTVARRATTDYVLDKIRESNVSRKIADEDHYFRKLYPELYEKVESKKEEINQRIYSQPKKYNGSWLMQTFNLSPGPHIGKILKSLEQQFGTELDNVPEDEVKEFVKTLN